MIVFFIMPKKYFHNIKKLLVKKSKKNYYTNYFITAIAFNKKNELLGISNNKIGNNKNSKFGCGLHAERELIKKYKNNIKTIFLYRRGHSFDTLPIHPCKICQKIIDKYNIKVILVHEWN